MLDHIQFQLWNRLRPVQQIVPLWNFFFVKSITYFYIEVLKKRLSSGRFFMSETSGKSTFLVISHYCRNRDF